MLYYEKQTVPRFSVVLAMKNKTPFDMTLKIFVSEKNNFFEKNKRIPGIGAEYKDSEHIFD